MMDVATQQAICTARELRKRPMRRGHDVALMSGTTVKGSCSASTI
jgi:hypothetical protein